MISRYKKFSQSKESPPPSESDFTMTLSEDDELEEYLMSTVESGQPLDQRNAKSKKDIMRKGDGTFKLLYCSMGIYVSYLYYGTIQEQLFKHTSTTIISNPAFKYVWFVQVVEAFVNAIVGFIGLHVSGSVRNPKPQHRLFLFSGFSQVCSKALTGLSLSSGLSFPLATMAKSGKMAPVMFGQLILGGSHYCLRDYAQVGLIIAGTALLGLARNKGNDLVHSTKLGVIYIVLSLVMDGVTGGLQKRLKNDSKESGYPVKGYEFMMYTNLYMFFVALYISGLTGDLTKGYAYCLEDEAIRELLFKFCACSAVGQSFIFYTIASFDPLVCSTITTTRKISSVFLSIFYRGHYLNSQGWCGVFLASIGVIGELQAKASKSRIEKKKLQF